MNGWRGVDVGASHEYRWVSGSVSREGVFEMNAELESVLADVGRTVTAEARRRQLVPEIQARLAHFESRRARTRGWSLALGLGLCGAAAAVLVLRPHTLSFAIAGTAGNGQLGAALVAPSAAAHVDALDGQGATLAIEDGTLEVSVVHRARTHWQVRAGGYRIQVTGTRFDAGWDRRAQSLTVDMHEGAVLVSGPGLKEPVRVVTGQRLQASAGGAQLGFEAAHDIAAREEMPPL